MNAQENHNQDHPKNQSFDEKPATVREYRVMRRALGELIVATEIAARDGYGAESHALFMTAFRRLKFQDKNRSNIVPKAENGDCEGTCTSLVLMIDALREALENPYKAGAFDRAARRAACNRQWLNLVCTEPPPRTVIQ